MTEDFSFGKWLRQRRRMLDLSQQALADQSGCARITLSRIEADTLKPSKELVQILLKKLDISESEYPKWTLFARGLSGFPTSGTDSVVSPPLTNLPASLTTFIGREKEQAEIIKLIRKYRLVTLTGPGGVGKTRLSIKVGEQVLGEFADGVWLAELASLNGPVLLAQTIMVLFGMVARPNISHMNTLINFLRAKTSLLILDNCEHLLDACAQLTDTLLKNCPNLKILATSREPFGIIGEAAYPVPSLALPDLEQLLENFRGYESVFLFEERAQLAKADFSLTMENASSVAQICHRLDGIPLAIELAAAHVRMFSTEQIATKLTESFNLLTGGSRTALPRQQTIRASIEWGWNLLSDSEQILMRRLSVFAGGWILESAESVCSENGLEKKQVVELMTQLVAKSLVIMKQESGREPRYPARGSLRYHLLETIREYAREKLDKSGERETIYTQHLKCFLKLSEEIESGLRGPQQVEWLVDANDERDNIRAALEWADKTNVEAGLFLSARLYRFWESFDLRGGALWLNRFIQNPEANQYPIAKAQALIANGWQLYAFQEFGLAEAAAREGLELYQSSDDQSGEIDALILLGAISQVRGKINHKFFQQALSKSRELKDTWREARTLVRISIVEEKLQRKISLSEEAITLLRKAGDLRFLAIHLGTLGKLEVLMGDFESAQKRLDEAMQLNRQLNNRAGMGDLLTALSRIESIRGNFEKGRILLEEGIAIVEKSGHRMNYLWARAHLGYIALQQGELQESHDILAETTQGFYEDQSEIGVAFTLEGIASLNVIAGKFKQAAQLIGWANAIREKVGDLRQPLEQADVDKIITTCIDKMGEDAFLNAYDAGKKMTMDEAVELAVKE